MHTADVREQMIEQQVRAWDVLDARVLEVMRRVPRELFVPPQQRYRAYADVEVLDADALSTDSGARYGAIAVTASLPLYDARFERMLTPGGRLFVVVGEAPIMEARLVRRTAEDAWSTESLFETVIDPLVHAVRPAGFTF